MKIPKNLLISMGLEELESEYERIIDMSFNHPNCVFNVSREFDSRFSYSREENSVYATVFAQCGAPYEK